MLNFKVIRKVELLEANFEHGEVLGGHGILAILYQARGGHTGHHYYIT